MVREESGMVLRQALASAVRVGVGRAYPAELRARAIAYIVRRRRDGVSDERISVELGVHVMTFRKWVGGRTNAFASVAVIEPPRAGALVVHGPRGMRIEGLALDEIAQLWERLS